MAKEHAVACDDFRTAPTTLEGAVRRKAQIEEAGHCPLPHAIVRRVDVSPERWAELQDIAYDVEREQDGCE